ncbi:DUF3679 domain-containing protein [Aquibacillus albus]|uniref:DUF3679 domain-containing protein n=1 Tax=Aquibacillus albus TaxID=1168171 RepID=A0ABS2MUT4_9BACI|nr:DUF3679 domain-containing protein [Aquibacillus albus]MBM7569608.1 hypothetical protein [Aquibacillus albus]
MKMIVMMLTMIVLFLTGILIGIDQANGGITKTRGYVSQDMDKAIESNLSTDGKYEIKVMGNDFQQINLNEKEEKYQAVQSSHFTQQLAGNLEYVVKWFYNQIIHSAYQLAQAFF